MDSVEAGAIPFCLPLTFLLRVKGVAIKLQLEGPDKGWQNYSQLNLRCFQDFGRVPSGIFLEEGGSGAILASVINASPYSVYFRI
jgi:hypothetical protein